MNDGDWSTTLYYSERFLCTNENIPITILFPSHVISTWSVCSCIQNTKCRSFSWIRSRRSICVDRAANGLKEDPETRALHCFQKRIPASSSPQRCVIIEPVRLRRFYRFSTRQCDRHYEKEKKEKTRGCPSRKKGRNTWKIKTTVENCETEKENMKNRWCGSQMKLCNNWWNNMKQ